MPKSPQNFADFKNPPVSEVALSVQFERLEKLRTPYIGLLWKEYENQDLTTVDEKEPLEPVIETFENIRRKHLHVMFSSKPEMPRIWFINNDDTELVQIQQDRFVRNWRKRAAKTSSYPRYSKLKNKFIGDYKIFTDFLAEYQLGDIKPNQCEVTYVNPIPAESKWIKIDDIDKIIRIFRKPNPKYNFLPETEDINLGMRFIIHNDAEEPIGRLYISLQPVISVENERVFLLTLTSRLSPATQDLNGVLHALDLGREWIVRGFIDITSQNMHIFWGIKE